MPTLLNPSHVAAYDPASGRIVLTLRDGRESVVIELEADATPPLINALMKARAESKRSGAAAPPVPEPAPDRTECGSGAQADSIPIRPVRPHPSYRDGAGIVGVRGAKGGRVRRS
jgi:hypothetical protein